MLPKLIMPRLVLNPIQYEIEKIVNKNQNGFQTNLSTTSHVLTICRMIQEVREKNLVAILLFINLQVIQSYTRRKDGANTTSIWSLQKNFWRYDDALQKHESDDSITRWRHTLSRHCCRSLAMRYTSIIFVT